MTKSVKFQSIFAQYDLDCPINVLGKRIVDNDYYQKRWQWTRDKDGNVVFHYYKG